MSYTGHLMSRFANQCKFLYYSNIQAQPLCINFWLKQHFDDLLDHPKF